ncbi:hypothetical protein ACFSQ7_25070 [Paenibacillus rhizoplanae]
MSEVYIDEATAYEDLIGNKEKVIEIVNKEENLFYRTLQQGEVEIQKNTLRIRVKLQVQMPFYFFTKPMGFPWS